MSIFTGVATAITTPFNEKGVDLVALKKQIEFQIESGVDAIVVLGTTGESSTIDNAERTVIIRNSVDIVARRVPVIVGTGSNNTQKAIFYSRQAQELGADGLLVVTPYYNKCTQQGLVEHYKKIAYNVAIPIILYNVPSRTNVNIAPKTLQSLMCIQNIVAIKDASGDLIQMQEYYAISQNKSFDIYCGDDALVIPYFSQNATGVISVISNILPKEMSILCQLCKNSDFKNANRLYSKIMPINRALLTEVNPIGIKTAMRILGQDSGLLRQPLCKMSLKHTKQLKKVLDSYFDTCK